MLYNNKKKFRSLSLKENDFEIIENLDVGFFRVSLDGTILVHNQKYNEIFGIDPLKCLNGEKTFNFWQNQHDREKFLIALKNNGKVKNYIAFAKKLNGEPIVLQGNSHLIYDDKGAPIATEGTIIDITEKHNLQKELEVSEKRYRDIAELLPDVIYETDLNLNLTYVNSVAFEKFGYTQEDLSSGLTIGKFVDSTYLDVVRKNIKLLFEGKELTPKKYLLVKKDGTKFYGLVHSRPIYENNTIIGLRGTITDINNLILTEKELKESEDKFKTIAEQSLLGIAILQDDKFKYVNQKFANLSGRTVDEVKKWGTKDFLKVIHPEDKAIVINFAKKRQLGIETKTSGYECRCFKKNGEIMWVQTYSKTITFDGKPADLITIIDVTDRKKTEYKLKESEQKYRSLFENMTSGFAYHEVITDNNNKPIDYKYLEVNPEFEKLTGLKKEVLLGKNVTEAIPGTENDPADWIGKFGNVGLTGVPLIVEEYSEALDRWYKVSGYSPKKGNFAVTFSDITENKRAEQKIKESEEKFRTMAEQSLMGICIIQDFEVKYLNQQMADIYGYPLSEINQWKPSEFVKVIHPDSRDMAMEQLKKKQQGSSDIITHYIAKLITKNGTIKYVENYSKSITFQGRTADLLTQIDITPKMIAEQKVKESEKKYRHLYESSPYAILLVNMEGKVIDCNKAAEELSGFNRIELLGKSFADTSFIPKEYLYSVIKDYETLIKTGILVPREIQLFTRDSERVWVSFQASTFQIENEKVIQVLIEKIEERKKAEEKIKQSETKYHNLFENSPIALTIQDYSEIRKYIYHLKSLGINDFEKFFDDNPEEVLKCLSKAKMIDVNKKTLDIYNAKNKEEYFDRIKKIGQNMSEELPKDIIRYNKMELLSLINGGRIFESETVSKKFTGETIHLYAKTSIVPEYEDKWSNVIVSILDITDKKLTEQKLKLSEEKYHQLYETSPDGVLLTDVKGDIKECNTAIELIVGYSAKELIGKNFMDLDLYVEDGLTILRKGYEDLLGDHQLNGIEIPIETKEGILKWIQLNANLLNMQSETYILAVIHDITELKEAEYALKESEKKFRDILETSSVGVMELDVFNKKLLYINPKLINMVGYKREEITEEIFRQKIIHKSDLAKLIKTNEEAELEFRITDKQDRIKWLAGKRIPHYNKHGEIDSIRVWLDDITEKKMYENLIYELNINFLNFTTDIRKNIDLLLNTCLKLLDGDLLLYVYKTIVDEKENYQIITSNNKTYNFSSKQFNNLFISILFQEEHDFPQTFLDINRMNYAESDQFIKKNKFKGCFGKVIKSHEGLNSGVCLFYKNNPIVSGQDKLVMFLICDALEIEQRRWKVQKDLEKQNITLNKINKLKSELFSRTSHELKTPLISVKGFTELLLTLYKSKLDPEVISIIEEISDGSKRLEKIINLLLDSTKLEAGQLSLNLKDEDLAFLIKFCVKELQGLAKLRDQNITLKLQDNLETKFDKERIYEVISNLLVNAIKYTPPGGNITIESKKNDGSFEISVKDNGIGFTDEEKSQVFKQFGKIERYGQGWDIAADGTGLGLYITKKLIELHGGKIWLESEGRNKGTIFYFSIPKLK